MSPDLMDARLRSNEEWLAAFTAYLVRCFPDRSTAKHYTSDLRCFLAQQPGPLLAVTRADLDAFVDAQHAAGLAPGTVKRRAASLHSFFAFVAEERAEPTRPNPVAMRRHAGRQPHLLPRDLTDAEVTRVLAVVTDLADQAAIHLMLYAGLRAGEVCALHPADLTWPTDPTAPVLLRVWGKGRKERRAYLTAAAAARPAAPGARLGSSTAPPRPPCLSPG